MRYLKVSRENETVKLIEKYLRKYYRSLAKDPAIKTWFRLRVYSIIEGYYLATYKHKFNTRVLTYNDISYIRSVLRKDTRFTPFFNSLVHSTQYQPQAEVIHSYLQSIRENLLFSEKPEYKFPIHPTRLVNAM